MGQVQIAARLAVVAPRTIPTDQDKVHAVLGPPCATVEPQDTQPIKLVAVTAIVRRIPTGRARVATAIDAAPAAAASTAALVAEVEGATKANTC